jgi:hypothetical protein
MIFFVVVLLNLQKEKKIDYLVFVEEKKEEMMKVVVEKKEMVVAEIDVVDYNEYEYLRFQKENFDKKD